MICTKCKSKVRVIDIVHNEETNETYRLKKCTHCGYGFYTIEFEVEADKTFKDSWFANHRERKRERRT